MRKVGLPKGKTPSQMVDARIAELDDWRGETLARLRALIKQADANFKVKAFDEPGCEATCLGAYDTTISTKLTGCPACLGPTATADLASALTNQLHSNDASVYCSGTQPLH